jgi:hypothetical protein
MRHRSMHHDACHSRAAPGSVVPNPQAVAILAVGYAAGQFMADQPPVPSFPDTLTRDDLHRLVDVVAGGLAERAAVVAIYPAWHAEPSMRRLQTIRAGLESTQVLLYASPLPPLAGSVLCALAAAVAPHVVSAGILVGNLPLLERQLLPVARLRSVARLAHPAAGMGQHLASWWPPSTFGVSWWPEPHIRTLRRHDESVSLPGTAEWANLPLDGLALAGVQADLQPWVEDAIVAPLGVRDVVAVAPEPLAGRYWAVDPVLEVVAYPRNLGGLVSGVGYRQRARPCRWCGELGVASACPYCGADRLRRAREAG